MKTLLPVNLIIAFVWAAVVGSFSFGSLLVGFVVGFAALWPFSEFYSERYHRRFFGAIRLLLYFLYDLLMSSLAVARAVLSPSRITRPGFVLMPLDVRSDVGVFFTANLISLTPGTLSVDVDDEKTTLLIHAMFAQDPEDVIKSCKDGMERRVRGVFP